MLEILKEWAGVVEMFVITGGAGVALLTYRRDAKLRRAEWLYRLYQQFYANDRLDRIRALIDYAPVKEMAELDAALANNEGTELHEAFADYLNFFEFIAIQLKNGTLRRAEVLDMFDYYIRRLADHGFIISYIENFGYENLGKLISSVSVKK